MYAENYFQKPYKILMKAIKYLSRWRDMPSLWFGMHKEHIY